jgi:hypothetical protein
VPTLPCVQTGDIEDSCRGPFGDIEDTSFCTLQAVFPV